MYVPAINYIDPGLDIELSEWHKHESWLVMQYVMTDYTSYANSLFSWNKHMFLQFDIEK